MIDLAHNLAKSDTKFFGGWVLAGATAHIHRGQVVQWENTVLLSKERKSILQVTGKDADGNAVKQLEVILVLPKGVFHAEKPSTAAVVAEQVNSDGRLVAQHVFTEAEIADYIAQSGDENVIHKGAHAVVPGLCMVAWLQDALQAVTLDWRVRFLSPVYIGDDLKVVEADDSMTGYVGANKVFTIRK